MTDEKKKPVPALPASSVLLIRDGRGGLEVLMIERAKTMRFAPGALVFPGGKVDPADFEAWRWHRYVKHNPGLMHDAAFRIASARELYEETNILLGTRRDEGRVPKAMPFEKLLSIQEVQLDIGGMVPFAHWVTPETMPRRFDTHFFLAADEDHLEEHDGEEAVSAHWLKPREVLADWEADRVPLMFPTRLNLMKLARSATVTAAFQAARQAPVVRVLPRLKFKDQGVDLTIPQNAGYGVTKATAKELSVEGGKRR